ncbi:mini-chromosome maintenance complex-binding protein [Anopheles maculipalpis]|uniref:mini-chromosome maintenance complex-binding protein n=1 Tax=Anopheles maculipalpis TaxID=1496333 RepID=UPI0021595497|nr:mini-chromosome maintenance complex-binding protein [Anopheles maculipalpis]
MESDPASWTPEYFIAHEASCLKQLATDEVWATVPLLNRTDLAHLPDGCLVRFRGMLQDMQDPECYLERYTVRLKSDGTVVRQQNGKYRDILLLNGATETVDTGCNAGSSTFGERRSLFVVTIPGQNPWTEVCEKEHRGSLPVVQMNGGDEDTIPSSTGGGTKRRTEADNEEVMDVDGTPSDSTTVLPSVTVNGVKKRTPTNDASSSSGGTVLSADYLLNSPIADRPGKACLVKLYSNYDDWTLNTVIEVVGFLSVDPALDGSGDSTGMEEFADDVSEHQATHPPPSLIPRLHAISVRKLAHTNPLLLEQPQEDSGTGSETTTYKDLHNLFTQCLFGDGIAADYLLCHLVSSVYIRDEVECRGQFCLNLSNIPAEVLPDYTRSLYELLELLLPASHYLPMTLENMNTVQFVPKKDYTTNKLTSGLLQLAPHTHLVLDETRLQAGKLEAPGVEAVKHVAHLIKCQRLKCNFQYYQLDFNADVPVLVLSEGRSMLPSNCYLPIVPDLDAIKLIEETIKAGRHFIGPKLDEMRRYLTAARVREFDMKTLDPTVVQDDFVRMRTENSAITMDDLHALFVLARLHGLSRGRASLLREDWERAKALECERRNRIEMFSKTKSEP